MHEGPTTLVTFRSPLKPGANPLRDVTNTLNQGYEAGTQFQVTETSINGSPLKAITETPRKRLLQKAPVEIYVEMGRIALQENPRFLIDANIFNTLYSPKKAAPLMLTAARKNEILCKLPFFKLPYRELATTNFDYNRRMTFKGQRKYYHDQHQVMHQIWANEYVAAVEPALEAMTNWEWLHLLAFCLGGPKNTGPQHTNNLVAGTKECNQLMKRFEYNIAKAVENGLLGVVDITAGVESRPCPPPYSPAYSRIANNIHYVIQDRHGNAIKVNFYGIVYYGYPKTLDQYANKLVKAILDLFSQMKPKVPQASKKLKF